MMRTWWIVKASDGPHIWAYWGEPLATRSIGPYWTREEAERILRLWR